MIRATLINLISRIIPDSGLKKRLRCIFYNAKLKGTGMRMRYQDGVYEVIFLSNTLRFAQNPFYLGIASVSDYFRRFRPAEGDVVVDAGACIGAFALLASRLVGPTGRVIAFEPDPRNFASLLTNIKLNSIKNITVVKKGLWHQSGTLLFSSGIGQYSSISTHGMPAESSELAAISATTLDDFFDSQQECPVDFIKADIEGAELEMVEGAKYLLRRFRPKLAIATYHIRDGSETALRIECFLAAIGYRVYTEKYEQLITYAE